MSTPNEAIDPRDIEYIDTNCYHEELSLEQIAASAYVSSGYACTVYKKYSGKSINTYIKDKRMEKAMELLRNTRLLVTNIAQIVGYDNPRYFSMLFKKHTGRTPMEYQADEQR